MIKSKFELRQEAAKLVMQLPGTTMENFHERAYRMEQYLQDEVELPETYSETSELKESIEVMLNSMTDAIHKAHTDGKEICLRDAALFGIGTPACDCASDFASQAPGGMPSSDGEALGLDVYGCRKGI